MYDLVLTVNGSLGCAWEYIKLQDSAFRRRSLKMWLKFLAYSTSPAFMVVVVRNVLKTLCYLSERRLLCSRSITDVNWKVVMNMPWKYSRARKSNSLHIRGIFYIIYTKSQSITSPKTSEKLYDQSQYCPPPSTSSVPPSACSIASVFGQHRPHEASPVRPSGKA